MNEENECVWRWTPASLFRGPIEIVNGPILLMRCPAEGVYEVIVHHQPEMGARWLWAPPVVFVLGTTVGLIEGMISTAFGVADTLTLGCVEFLPDEWTKFALLLPEMACLSEAEGKSAPHDQCGRPLDDYGNPIPVEPTPTPGPLPPAKLRP